MANKKLGRKGAIEQIMTILIVLVVLSVVTLIVYKVSDSINTEFQADDKINDRGKTAMNDINNMYPGVLDNSFMLLLVGLAIVGIVFAGLVRVHPIFFVFFLLIFVVLIFLGGVFSNIYQKVASNPEMTALADNLTYMTYGMQYLPFIVGILGFVISFIMYKSWQNS